jgi:hypothetical protein
MKSYSFITENWSIRLTKKDLRHLQDAFSFIIRHGGPWIGLQLEEGKRLAIYDQDSPADATVEDTVDKWLGRNREEE